MTSRDTSQAMIFSNNDSLMEEIRDLRDRLSDWESSVRDVMNEPCESVVHCTCVPLLRDEVRRLQSCLRFMEAQPEVFGKNASTYARDAIDCTGQGGANARLRAR